MVVGESGRKCGLWKSRWEMGVDDVCHLQKEVKILQKEMKICIELKLKSK